MQTKSSTFDRWQFSSAVLLPVVMALVITAGAVLGFVFWSTAGIDQRALERQSSMVAQVIAAKRSGVQHDLESVTIWDDAVASAHISFDFDWVHMNLGVWMNDFFGHNRTMVVTQSNEILYAMEHGEAVDPALLTLPHSIITLLGRVRDQSRSGSVEALSAIAASDFAVIDGMPAIVSAMAIVSDTGDLVQPPGSESILVATLFLDDAVAKRLSGEYLFENGAFSLTRTNRPDRAVAPILSDSGRFIAFYEWDRDRPGLLMLRQTGPVLAVAFVVAAVLVFLLLRQLRRSSAALEAGRRHAEHQAAHDRLTGLPNRTSFDTELVRALAQPMDNGSQVNLLMLDLDRFKQVNDTLGHQAGDALICAVADRLRAIVGQEMLIARLGGDEFALLSVSRGRQIDVMAVSQRIIESIGHPFEINHFKAHVGVSIGIVNAAAAHAEPRELVRKADIALYEAKASGRNRAVVYEEHMNELLQLQHTIEGELREALRRQDQLSVVFQPLVDQQSRKVIGAEALARWHHPKYGQISPARFIPVAENTGLIEALGDFVLRRACEMGASAPGRTIAVNISPTQLRNPLFSNQVFDILHQTGMRPLDLELEITESILLDDEHISAQNLRTFRAAGIHIALDDFGTGYSSLSYLKRYPVDRIKIDRSFVSQLAEGHVSVAITRAIVTLAHAMDIEVTAEGVETEDQANILGGLGCNTLQGFLFSGGVKPEKITEIFADEANAIDRRRRVRAA